MSVQMEDTPTELLESKESSVASDITENEFTDTSVTDDDLLMTFQRLTLEPQSLLLS